MQYTLLALSFCLTFAACRNDKTGLPATSEPAAGTSTQSPGQAELPGDFLEFYRRFHADSVYQLEHIQWPLQGETSYSIGDTTQGPQQATSWQRESWRMHHDIGQASAEFNRTFEQLGDVMIIERIRSKAGNYGLERRFAKQPDGSWELIFYSDMHEMRR